MAEATAAPVRALMHGRLCHPGLGGDEGAGDGRGPCRPRGSAAVAAVRKGRRGPQRRATPGDPGLLFLTYTRRGASCQPADRGSGLEAVLKPASPSVRLRELALLGAAGQSPARRGREKPGGVLTDRVRTGSVARPAGTLEGRRSVGLAIRACARVLQACSGPSRACTR